MKKLICLLSALTLLMSLVGGLSVAAAGSASISANKSTVTVGDQVTVTAKYSGGDAGIGSLDASFEYSTKTFEYVSCTGASAGGGAGKVNISYYATDINAPKSVTITITLKAIAAGEGNFKWTTEGMYDDNDTLLGTPGKSLSVSANNPTLSGNADLKSLTPSKGTLKPKFDPDVTEYRIDVYNSVESLSLSAPADHSDAKTHISGKNELKVGENTRVITVTAPNGTTKKYTVVIYRQEAPSTTTTEATTTESTTTTTTEPIPEDALDVEIGGKTLTISDTQVSGNFPKGFTWGTVTINRVEVPASIHEKTNMTLLYLTGENEADSGYYIYNAETDTFTRFRSLEGVGATYLLYDVPADSTAIAGAAIGLLEYEGGSVTAYAYEAEDLSDYFVVWASTVEGQAGWYTYDRAEGTFQRYHAAPAATTTTAPTTGATQTTAVSDEKESQMAAIFGEFITNYRQPLLIGAIALAVIIVVVIIVVVISASKRKNSKH